MKKYLFGIVLMLAAFLFGRYTMSLHVEVVNIGHYTGFSFYPKVDNTRIAELEKELGVKNGLLQAYISGTMVFPESHGHGQVISTPPNINEGTTLSPDVWYQYPRMVRGSNKGDYVAETWLIDLIITEQKDGSFNLMTDEPGVSFEVKEAVKVKPQWQAKWSASYLYGTDNSHEVIIGRDIWQWLSVKAGTESGNQVVGKAGVEINF